MNRSPTQAVKFKRKALGWTIAKLAAESQRDIDDIHVFEVGDSSEDQQLTAALMSVLDEAIAQLLPYWVQIVSGPDLLPAAGDAKANRKLALILFGNLLKDRRNKAHLSRRELGTLAGVSDATIKFIETARHPPSRGTCQRLVAVGALKLTWADVEKLGYVGKRPDDPASESDTVSDDNLPSTPELEPDTADDVGSPSDPELEPDTTGDVGSSSDPELDQDHAATAQDSTAAGAQHVSSGEGIEEEITVHIRLTIKRM